jgi:hypothetical protein
MKKPAVDPHLLHLLVSVYNQSIQTYYHFPEVILCGRQRLEPEDLALLLSNEFVFVSSSDSFGRNYRLSKKGETYLFQSLIRRRPKMLYILPAAQYRFSFAEGTI